jgi:hypothetical protein
MTHKSGVFPFRRVFRPRLVAKEHNSTLLTLVRFVHLEVVQHMRKARWWLVFPVSIATTFILLGNMLASVSQRGIPSNIWDGLFTVFANQYAVLYLLTPLYLYLMSDLASDSWFNEAVVLRLRSRRRWWFGKVASLSILMGIYLGMLVGVVVAIASCVLPWENQWSAKTVQYPAEIYLPSTALAFSPGYAFSLLLLLLAMGWFCVGLSVLISAHLLGSARWGFTVGLLINLSGIITLHEFIPDSYSTWLWVSHLLLGWHDFGDSASAYPSIATSLMYWFVWIMFMFFTGWWLNARHDFLREE